MPEAQGGTAGTQPATLRRRTFERAQHCPGAPAPVSPLADHAVLHLMAGGDMLPSQGRGPTQQSGELRLAAAVFATAMADSLWSEGARNWLRLRQSRSGYRADLLCDALNLHHGAVLTKLERRWERLGGYTPKPRARYTCDRRGLRSLALAARA